MWPVSRRVNKTGTGDDDPTLIDEMPKRPTPESTTLDLTVRERILLFCIASETDWQRAGIAGETVTTMAVKDLIERDAGGHLALTAHGRTALRAMLPDL